MFFLALFLSKYSNLECQKLLQTNEKLPLNESETNIKTSNTKLVIAPIR